KQMIKKNMPIQGAKVTVLGFTFKENVPDLRNTRVIDIVNELADFGVEVQVTDSYADAEEALSEYNIDLIPYEELKPADAVVYSVPHDAYLEKGWEMLSHLLKHGKGIVIDVKCSLNRLEKPSAVFLWRLYKYKE